jgi:hypothetical protein
MINAYSSQISVFRAKNLIRRKIEDFSGSKNDKIKGSRD